MDHLVVFGETVDLICNAVGEVIPDQRPFTIDRCAGLEEAVQKPLNGLNRAISSCSPPVARVLMNLLTLKNVESDSHNG